MKYLKLAGRICAWLAVIGLAAFIAPTSGEAQLNLTHPFQFSDSFYAENGINPDAIVDKLGCGDPRVKCDEAPPDSRYSGVRIIETTGGFQHNSNLFYYWVPGKVMPNTFTDDAAGDAARELADNSFAYLFPKAGGNPLSPAFPNRRQDNIFDNRHGYFSNNPLGLWTIRFVSWDGPNVNGSNCQAAMDSLAADNGLDLDGTPVIKTVADIENLQADGCVQVRERAKDGSQGFPWVI